MTKPSTPQESLDGLICDSINESTSPAVTALPPNVRKTLEAGQTKGGSLLVFKASSKLNETRLAGHLLNEIRGSLGFDCATMQDTSWADLEQRFRAQSKGATALVLTGLDDWLAKSTRIKLGAMNVHREAFFRSLEMPVLMLLRPETVSLFATTAVDFWSWRDGVFDVVYEDMFHHMGPDDMPVFKAECPACGADEGQRCSEPDPEHEGFGIEMGSTVHVGRLA